MMGWFLGLFRRPAFMQVAALCLRPGPEVLLVRSDRGNWILPKGWPMAGKSLAEAAEIEAWEEAGVRGRVHAVEMACLKGTKRLRGGMMAPCDVRVFRLDVTSVADDYPEAAKRARKWLPLSDAVAKVNDPALAQFLRELAQEPLTL